MRLLLVRKPGFHGVLSVVFLAELLVGAAAEPSIDTRYLRDHAETRGFMLGRPGKVQPTPDGTAVIFLRAEPRLPTMRLFEFDVTTGRTIALLAPEQLLRGAEERLSPEEKARRERMRVSVGGFTDFQLSPDGSLILVTLSGRLYVVGRADGHIRELKTGPGTLVDPKFSPDGRKVGYVLGQDVYSYDLESEKETRVTIGGTELVTHGLAEFVAQEEMGRFSGYWWSPDSQFIAYQEADAAPVEVWYVADPAKPEVPPHASRYPRPGKANVSVRLGVTKVRGGKTIWIDWDRRRHPYLARVDWHKSGGLTLSVQTRDQQELVLLRADPKTGRTQTLLTETDPAWINLDQQMPFWIEGSDGFLWTSDRAGGTQLELRDNGGGLIRVLVPSSAGYQRVADVNSGAGQIVVQASPDPGQAHLYRVPLAGGVPAVLTDGRGRHNATFSKNHAIFVHQISDPSRMPESTVRRTDGQTVGMLPSVAEEPPFKPRVEWLMTGRQSQFHALIVRPADFDPTHRYPVVMYVYGGPTANVVQSSMGAHLLKQWIANQGFIVVSMDGRGTPGRGRDWERSVAKRFGSVTVEDHAEGIEELVKRFPEMDAGRVGVFGWSFGGYLSALAVLRRPEVFQAGVAGAPVVDWLDYDTHYTERYLGMPDSDADAYREGSLLTYAADLRRPLLLIHGTADDNVYFRHSLKLAAALFRAGRPFEILPLPGLTHMVPDPVVTERMYARILEFFRAHLGKPESK